ncbi:MAG TPA: penicillin-insensitive murein endopeptidase [Pyrinomonadaceae bacterium]|nr:penicillin-insensitive murein endopeptidase [Pyrinomonadaceae bacterium]
MPRRLIDQQLPPQGPGFVTYNRETSGADQYGQPATIEAVKRVGLAWSAQHPDRPFSVGDISRKGGGKFAPHGSHRHGLDVDVRPMRKDGKNLKVTVKEAEYDSDLTLELIRLFRKLAHVDLILFNDKAAINAGLSREYAGHDNHLHIRLHQI